MPKRAIGGRLEDFLFKVVVTATVIIVAAFFATRPTINLPDHKENYPQANQKAQNEEGEERLLWIGPEGWTAIFTGTLTIATIILATISFMQIKYLVKADKNSRRSAKAAQKSAEIAERSLLATQRAYIICDGISQGSIIDGQDKSKVGGWRFDIKLRNAGPTAAKNARSAAAIMLISKPQISDDVKFDPPELSPRLDIGPNVQFSAEAGSIKMEVVDRVRERTGCMLIWFRIEYNDIFEGTETHHLEMCVQMFVVRDPTIQSRPGLPTPFTHSAFRKFNSSS
jgi:hypothetical protein